MGVSNPPSTSLFEMQHLDGEDSELFEKLVSISSSSRNPEVESAVASILKKVCDEGDDGLLSFTSQFDRASLSSAEQCVTTSEFNQAEEALESRDRSAIEETIENVRAFHSHCQSEDWMSTNSHGGAVGERYYPLRRVGIYVPGGQVPLVSTVIMTTVLAKTAGVPEIAVTTPPRPDGTIAPPLLAAFSLCGVDEVYKAGGAQAVAALAYGTETIAPVDKIFGPGNAYVNEAKRQVFGTVGIDLLPGPSEVMVVADETARPAYVAAALLAQAEHGSGKENVFLVCLDENILQLSLAETEKQLEILSRRDAIRSVLKTGLFSIRVSSEKRAFEVANFVAPEHLELQIDDSKVERFTSSITTAGSILQGHYTPTVLGDFAAGPSHVLPTGRTSRFSAGLRLSDFFRRSSIVRYDLEALRKADEVISRFSAMEELDAHGRSLSIRFENFH